MLAFAYWQSLLIGSAVGIVLGLLIVLVKVKCGRNARGIRALGEGRYDEAERWFTELVDRGKTRSLAYRTALVNRAVARLDAGRPREARVDLEAARKLLGPKRKLLRSAWLFNDAYCRIVLDELDGVEAAITQMESLDVRPMRVHTTRLRILLAAREGRFDDAAGIADEEAQGGTGGHVPQSQRFAHTLHAFVLHHASNADERRDEIAELVQKARAIDAPAPVGLGAQWPAWQAFLSERALA